VGAEGRAQACFAEGWWVCSVTLDAGGAFGPVDDDASAF
jgi:hypothetical protein